MYIDDLPNLPLYVDSAYLNGNWKYYTMNTTAMVFWSAIM